jgi:phosphate starvation-inducible PhoH-like protein
MQKFVELHNNEEARLLFGRYDENLRLIEDRLNINTLFKDRNLIISGSLEAIEKAAYLTDELLKVIRGGGRIKRHELDYAISAIDKKKGVNINQVFLNKIEVLSKRQYITPKSIAQKAYVDAIKKYDLVFGIGPAGTGKTYLAMAMAVCSLKKKQVNRIILTRPAIEAGENLGYLPGDLYEKVNPYLRPLYDALYDMIEIDNIKRLMDKGVIEIAPLAFMRGRTLNDAFIILDEAQNCTVEQMKMFLTRLGFDTKTVVTGDITQTDLPRNKKSGLVEARSILKGIEGIKFIYFSGEDVVRHELVQEIIEAYERHFN